MTVQSKTVAIYDRPSSHVKCGEPTPSYYSAASGVRTLLFAPKRRGRKLTRYADGEHRPIVLSAPHIDRTPHLSHELENRS